MAVALADGCAFPDQFVDARANDELLHSLRDRIDVNADESLPRGMAVVTIELTNGETITERVPHAAGRPENPITDAQVQEKFKSLAAAALPGERVMLAAEALWRMEGLENTNDLMPLLTA